ncbi:hypothetical protein NIES2119_20440 [[Phormidium ambiguum] IAM M-71]|uniref:DUF1517 domain-containing protein n=1 Tax=[Phormidium ambiguum] IAM M-71 TaxID=454136 RepID=A0A1U7IEI8_9CYAN|nr:DUF1517 domain-containing protein [Phormidium ambiguum]OKH35392.1 hypothetical protein NIES2119_20440 [Phormidium ambiguum IAM M-71]
MSNWRDRFSKMTGRTRFVVSRIFIHLAGKEVAPLIGVLNQAARDAIDAEGEIDVLGEGLEQICLNLLQNDLYWRSAANEGNVFWDEGEAGDEVNYLFTDSAQRYKSESYGSEQVGETEPFSIPVTNNLIVMITVAFEGEVPELETDLSNISALKAGLKALINLHYQRSLRAIQVHWSPAKLGDELTDDQIIEYYPEVIPL